MLQIALIIYICFKTIIEESLEQEPLNNAPPSYDENMEEENITYGNDGETLHNCQSLNLYGSRRK